MQRLLILAHGVEQQLTGVERIALSLAIQATESGAQVTVTADEAATWCGSLDDSVSIIRRPRPPMALARGASFERGGWDAMYSIGPTFPPRSEGPVRRAYTVHDWTVWRSRGIPVGARLAWCLGMLSAFGRTSVLHSLTTYIANSAPVGLRPFLGKPWIVDDTVVSAGQPQGLSQVRLPGGPFLLAVGSNTPRKRLALAAASASHLPPGWHIVLAGRGTETLGAPRVSGIGRVRDSELAWLYGSCAALLMISSEEGYGLPLAEAAMFGKKAFVSAEVLSLHQQTLRLAGRLFEVSTESPERLARDIVRMLPALSNESSAYVTQSGGLLEYLLSRPRATGQ